METYKEECLSKSITINKLQKAVSKLQSLLGERKNEAVNALRVRDEALAALEPTKRSLESMTALHGKLLRKLKRGDNK